MKILLLGDFQESEIFTGPQKYGKRIASNLVKYHQITFVAYFQDGTKYTFWDKLFGMELIQHDLHYHVYRLGIFRFLTLLIKNSYDIIHIVSFERFARIIFWFRLKKKARTVYTAHSLFNFEYKHFRKETPDKLQRLNSVIEKQYYEQCDYIVLVSNYLKELLLENKLLNNNCEIIYNGVDDEFIRDTKNAILHQKNLSVVFIGDITRKEKGFSVLESALRQCLFSIDLFIISFSTKELDLPKNITAKFVKPLTTERLAQFLSDKDIVATPSLYDSFSISTLEAMACGCVPIVSDSTGIAELISIEMKDNIVATNNGIALQKRIEKLYSDTELRKSYSLIAMRTAKNYEWSHIAREYNTMYEKITN